MHPWNRFNSMSAQKCSPNIDAYFTQKLNEIAKKYLEKEIF